MVDEFKIDIQNFRTWMSDPVTKLLFKALARVRAETELGMINASNILAEDCQQRMIKLLGIREGVDLVLEISFDDLENEVEDD